MELTIPPRAHSPTSKRPEVQKNMTGSKTEMNIRDILTISPVTPVIVIEDVENALPLAEALLEGGMRVMEITLRTDAALGAIERIAKHLPEALPGAGTVVHDHDVYAAKSAGAQFAVSPGFSEDLFTACRATHSLPLLPGVSSASDVVRATRVGLDVLKFFPASAVGGTKTLQALAGPFPEIEFCPTGGISPHNAADYLSLPNVICVGGSWLTPLSLQREKNWKAIRQLAAAAVKGEF